MNYMVFSMAFEVSIRDFRENLESFELNGR